MIFQTKSKVVLVVFRTESKVVLGVSPMKSKVVLGVFQTKSKVVCNYSEGEPRSGDRAQPVVERAPLA